MRQTIIKISLITMFAMVSCCASAQVPYTNNRAPLKAKEYIELPLGSIRPSGWLEEMLLRQRNGMTSQMDVLYPEVMGPRNGWLGGDGDQWERGPYWMDGLIPLAYILDDEALKEKAKPWIEWALASQREDGFFGPTADYPNNEIGIQRINAKDWWPRMVVLKYLRQYYSATGDSRVIGFMTNYFRYQLNTLPHTPLGNWTFWAEYRACDNLSVVYWLYNITGDGFLLDLAKLIHSQSHDYVHMFLGTDELTRINTIHCVNLAQGIKEPVVYYQQDPDEKYLRAVKQAFADIRKYHGQPQGMYGGDEALHGNNPTQGTELCAVAELMYSLGEMLQITGDLQFADHLEKITFNALPTQITSDFMARQYFQQPNQVMVTRAVRNFDINHGGTDLVFGLLSGYPCCTSNLHQAWPKFVGNLWYATDGGGLAAINYSPSVVEAEVAGGVRVRIEEETAYPMEGNIRFTVSFPDKKQKSAKFTLKLRIPSWAAGAYYTINGTEKIMCDASTVAAIERTWKNGDRIELELPMEISSDVWFENAVSVERGPLVYALAVEEKWEEKHFLPEEKLYGKTYFEVLPASPWNYGLLDGDLKDMKGSFEVEVDASKLGGRYPWSPENSPLSIRAKGKRIPIWELYGEMAGPVPYSRMIYTPGTENLPEETITLIPYGCTTLRISEFPVLLR